MLLHLQFPICDLRGIVNSEERLPSPSWPSAIANEEFVRSFGAVRRRRGGGLWGWVSENVFCDARRAVGAITSQSLPEFHAHGAMLRTAFRRLYSDGLALVKTEVGFSCALLPECDLRSGVWGFAELIDGIVNSTLRVKTPNGVKTVRVLALGKPISNLYERSTTRCASKHLFDSSGLVTPESPMLFVETYHDDVSDESLPWHKVKLDLGAELSIQRIFDRESPGPELFHWWHKIGDRELSVWLLRKSPSPNYSTYEFERKLRIYVLRLHAERVVLRRVLKFVAREDNYSHQAAQYYMNVAIKRIGRYSKYMKDFAAGSDDVTLFAQSYFEAISPGELDALLQRTSHMRSNIKRKVQSYLRSTPVNYISIQAPGGHVGDNYINSGQAVNMGPNSTTTNVTQNQIKDEHNLQQLASELQVLLNHMAEHASSSAEKSAIKEVDAAQQAAKENQPSRTMGYLKNAGEWALSTAKELALPVATEMLKKALGM